MTEKVYIMFGFVMGIIIYSLNDIMTLILRKIYNRDCVCRDRFFILYYDKDGEIILSTDFRENNLVLEYGAGHREMFHFRFCPFCGRRLVRIFRNLIRRKK